MNVTNFPKCSVTVTAEQSPSILILTHEPFTVFSFPCPAEEESDREALVGTWSQFRINPPRGSAPSYISVCMVCSGAIWLQPGTPYGYRYIHSEFGGPALLSQA